MGSESEWLNLGGRAYPVVKLGERGALRRRAVPTVNKVLAEKGLAFRRGAWDLRRIAKAPFPADLSPET